MKYELGSKTYGTKGEAKEAVRTVLHNPWGNPLVREGEQIAADLFAAAVLAGMWDWEIDVDHYTTVDGGRGTTCIAAVDTHGDTYHYSSRHKFARHNPTVLAMHALRTEVAAQARECRESAIGTLCPISSAVLRRGHIDADHAGVGFAGLAKMWLAETGYDLASMECTADRSTRGVYWLACRRTADEWAEWHRGHAQLVALDRTAHRALTATRVLNPRQ